jgi:hypothetical protein
MGTLSGYGRTATFTQGAGLGASTVVVTDKRTWTASATIYLNAPATPTPLPTALGIAPVSATLSDNHDTAVFVATGGTEPFAWTLADGLLGHLNIGSGRQVIYTRDRPGNNTIILTDGSDTVRTATVTQPDSATSLSISPTSATLANNGDTTVFLAVGGTASYSWSLANDAHGRLSTNSGDNVIYTRVSEGDNAVILRDQHGNRAVASVTQSRSPLSVTPSAPNLTANGQQAVLVASGGTTPYRWTVSSAASGNVNTTTGSQVIYTRAAAGPNTVILTDYETNVVYAIVTQP